MRRRWDVDALVLPHPHAVDFVRMRQPRHPVQAGEFVLGTHLAGLNLPSDPVRLVTALIQAIRGLPQGSPRIRLVVHLHDTVLDPGASTYRPAQVHRIDELVRACGGLLRLHRPFTETQLWDHLFSLDLSLVPALHGSHSVWPEACADLGTHVLLPAGTHAAAQRPCLVYDDADVDATSESLRAALGAALERDGARRADPQERWKERVTVAESLRGLYERLLGEPE
jgi:hypothetical protein